MNTKLSENMRVYPKKKIFRILFIFFSLLLLALIGYFIAFLFISHNNYENYFENKKIINVSNLREGDILFRRSAFFDFLQPGYFTHAEIYFISDKNIPSISESFIFDGVRVVSLDETLSKGSAVVKRIPDLNNSELNALKKWCKAKQNSEFTLNAFKKDEDGNSFYCSEYVWSGFMYLGIDLDSGSFADFTVTPQEIYDSDYLIDVGVLKEN